MPGGLEKRGNYLPRKAREQRAYRLIVAGSIAGGVGVIGAVLAIVSVVGAWVPIIAFIIAALCVVGLRRVISR